MKAVIYKQYGSPDVLHVQDVAKPTPKDHEILVKVHAVSIGYGDLLARNFKNNRQAFNMPSAFWLPARIAMGWNKPKQMVLGSEFSGVVEDIGKDVTKFKVGDHIFGYSGSSFGATAEYMTFSQDGIVALKPDNITDEEAVTIPYGALTALNLLRKANIQAGQKVLINGASGSIGSMALQLAKYYGAEVTAVCSKKRFEFVKALGADHVIDYTQQDFTKNGKTYDLIFDILGKSSFAKCKNSLTPNGIYLMASFKLRRVFTMLKTALTGGKRAICALSGETPSDLQEIKALIEAGHIRSKIDRTYPLEQTADAHRYIESGNKQGYVVIKVV